MWATIFGGVVLVHGCGIVYWLPLGNRTRHLHAVLVFRIACMMTATLTGKHYKTFYVDAPSACDG